MVNTVQCSLPPSARNSLEGKFMLFTQLYIIQGKAIEFWLVLPAKREYFCVELATFLS